MLENTEIIIPDSKHAKEICNLLIESIIVTCAPDYDNDPQIMKDWLANKTPENISQWIDSKNNLSFAALNKDKIIGFALMNMSGEILLNYVLPSYLHKGVGKQLLKALEEIAESKGIQNLIVVSTITAKRFYEKNGFINNGAPGYVGNLLGDFPLIKHLE